MKLFRKYAGLIALLVAVTVQAQTPPPAPTKPLSPSEMRDRVEALTKDINDDNRHVLHLQALVRKEKDVVKLTCVNDKLVQIKAQMNLFDGATLQLEALINNTDDSPRSTFADVEKAAGEVHRLRGEADGCAGELEMYKQESKADFDRPDLDDPTDGGPFHDPEQIGDPDVDVPGYATPFK